MSTTTEVVNIGDGFVDLVEPISITVDSKQRFLVTVRVDKTRETTPPDTLVGTLVEIRHPVHGWLFLHEQPSSGRLDAELVNGTFLSDVIDIPGTYELRVRASCAGARLGSAYCTSTAFDRSTSSKPYSVILLAIAAP